MSKWDEIKKLYIDNNIKIFPVIENGKTPLIDNWLNDCSCDYFQVLYWYTNSKNCNFGIPATPNNLFILDLDVHDENKNGVENFKRLLSDVFNIPSDIDISEICDTYKDVNYNDFQVLVPMYKGINGIDNFNVKLQEIFNRKSKNKKDRNR